MKREKFTTTLDAECKRRLSILSANEGMDRNEWIEKMVDEKWGKFKNDMENESNTRE